MAVLQRAEPVPGAPFVGLRGYAYAPDFGFLWWLEQRAVILTQTVVSHGTVATSTAFHDFLDDVLVRHWNRLMSVGGLAVVHDWRSIHGYDSAAAADYVARMRRRPPRYLRAAVMILPTHNTFMRLAVRAANAVATLTTGRSVEITADPELALRRAGLSDLVR